jgi:D-sedoheptulose 7-phosphate isomerase
MDLLMKSGGTEPLPYTYYANNRTRPFRSLAGAASYIIERITGMTDEFAWPSGRYNDPAHYLEDYNDQLAIAMSSIDAVKFNQAAAILLDLYDRSRNHLFVAGNGGAAAIASHFKCDHVKSISQDTWLQPSVIDLTADTALITAIANDIGYDSIFSKQLDMMGEGPDVLLVLSVSGNSGNILNVLSFAKEHNIDTIAITGMDGGKAGQMADVHINIRHSNYGIVEDVMQSIMHALAQFIRQSVMPEHIIRSARF